MAERETILKIEAITDHSCGSYRIGEIDTLPDDAIKKHIGTHGEYGYEEFRDFLARATMINEQAIREHRGNHTTTQARGTTK